MRRYSGIMREIAEWCVGIQALHKSQMRCTQGCARCCHGLFDVSLPDALVVAQGFCMLTESRRRAVAAKAAEIHKRISGRVAEFKAPYLLKMEDEPLVDRIVVRIPNACCPLLGPDGSCLIYSYRPLACRLEGIPMVDDHDGLFGDWCELNFVEGVSEEAQECLQRDYYGLQESERASTSHLSELLFGESQEALTVFIPSIVVEYERFWAPLLAKVQPADWDLPAPTDPT